MLVSRRLWLCSTAAGLLSDRLTAGTTEAVYRVDDQNVAKQTRRLNLWRGQCRIAALLFSTDYPTHFRLKPELHLVCTPAGIPVTGSSEYCFIHHQSIMCGHGKVRVEGGPARLDFYRQLPFPDPGRSDPFHKDYDLYNLGPSGMQEIVAAKWTTNGAILIDLQLHWNRREAGKVRGETIAIENRRYRIEQRGDLTIVDQQTRLAAATKPLVLQADRHSFHGVRVHDLIDVDDGGWMTDSEGRINPSGNFWDAAGKTKAPRWVDCTGTIGGKTVGMTLMASPGNVRNEWYVREFGLMEVSPTLGHDVRVTAEQPLVFATRFIAHDGPLSPAQADTLFDEFTAAA
jgi:hypothetical protein